MPNMDGSLTGTERRILALLQREGPKVPGDIGRTLGFDIQPNLEQLLRTGMVMELADYEFGITQRGSGALPA